AQLATNLVAVLTVKEGAVEFFNSLGSVQATAMTESSARADAGPTEPKRLQSLQVFRLTGSPEWVVTTAALSWPAVAERLVSGGRSAGLNLVDYPLNTQIAGSPWNLTEIRVASVKRRSPADIA